MLRYPDAEIQFALSDYVQSVLEFRATEEHAPTCKCVEDKMTAALDALHGAIDAYAARASRTNSETPQLRRAR